MSFFLENFEPALKEKPEPSYEYELTELAEDLVGFGFRQELGYFQGVIVA